MNTKKKNDTIDYVGDWESRKKPDTIYPVYAIFNTKIKKNNSCHEEIVRNTLGLELDPYLISNLKRFLI